MISPTDIQDAKNDIILVTTVFVVSDFMLNVIKNKPIYQTEWVNTTLGIILGCIIYNLFTNKLNNSLIVSNNNIYVNNAIISIVKWSTIFIVSNLFISYVSNKKPVFDQKWMFKNGGVIAGYVLYDLFIDPYVQEHVDSNYVNLVHDLIKVALGSIVSIYTSGGKLNENNMIEIGASLAGFGTYNLVVKQLF